MKQLFKSTKDECQKLEKERHDLTTRSLLDQMEGDALESFLSQQARTAKEIQRLREEVDSISKSYFLSFAISVKMNMCSRGNFVNVNVHDLFEESAREDIHWKEYPSYITQALENAKGAQ